MRARRFKPAVEALESLLSAASLYGYVPPVVDWSVGLYYPMDGNDVLGDCTAAAVDHTIETWTHRNCTLDQVKQFYFMTTGGADTGQYMSTVISYWASPGMAGHTVYAAQHLNIFNSSALRAAIYDTVGGVEVSLALPYTAILQTNAGRPWTFVSFAGAGAPYSAGAHEVELTGYNARTNTYNAISWGRHVVITSQFLHVYTTVAYAVEGPDMFGPNGLAANGQTSSQVAAEAARFAG